MSNRNLKSQVIGLREILDIILFVIILVIIFDLIAPYIGLRGLGIGERLVYKLKELFMMPIPDMLVMYHFDEGTGQRPIDYSGHHNDVGKLENAMLSIADAFIGNGSIQFKELSGYFSVEKPKYFDSIKGELTIDFWIKLEERSDQPIIETDNFNVRIVEDLEVWTTIKLDIGEKYIKSGKGKLERGSWTHVVIVYNSVTGKGEVFINGRITNSEAIGKYMFQSHAGGAFIVGRFKGFMDELRIYNRALGSAEIVMHFQGLY